MDLLKLVSDLLLVQLNSAAYDKLGPVPFYCSVQAPSNQQKPLLQHQTVVWGPSNWFETF